VGAWGIGIFEDDSALDFVDELKGAKDPSGVMKDAFSSATGAKYLVEFAGTDRKGDPACATVPLLGTGWYVAGSRGLRFA